MAVLADQLAACDADELPVIVAWLSGQPRQRRTGLGWAAVRDLPPPAQRPTLTVAAVDAALDQTARAAGPGSAGRRRTLATQLLAAATRDEQLFLRSLVTGDLRQGAQTGLLVEAVAVCGGVAAQQVRRALTLTGDLADVAVALRRAGPGVLTQFGLRVGRPVAPMLAQSAGTIEAALERTGPALVEWKLDGVRIQVHRDGEDVAVFTRTLDEVTDRLPEVVRAARSLPARSVVLDGETIALRPDGRPHPFQVTSARTARRDPAGPSQVPLSTLFFDVLHADGTDLLDEPAHRRRAVLEEIAPPALLVPGQTVEDTSADHVPQARDVASAALAAGHEGVLVKSLTAHYAMGRRGAAWVKVKPRITLDLVVLAAERGHGRRAGWLSNLHLGALDQAGEYGPVGDFVMLGKTFKGLTDAMLTWQTEHLATLAVSDDGHVLRVRPELVVEIAFDGVQTSPRYPAGMALRFARVLAHRPDKPAAEADTVQTVRRHHLAATGPEPTC